MRIFVLDLSGNLGGAKSRFKASLRVGVAPLIITLPPARIRSWVSKSIQAMKIIGHPIICSEHQL